MNMKLSLILLLVLFSCSNPKPRDTKPSNEIGTSNKELEKINGVIEFDLQNITGNSNPLAIYNPDGSKFIEISGVTIRIGDTEFNIKESDEKLLQNQIGARWFYPEYDILITDCMSETDKFYIIQIGGSSKYVNKHDNRLKYYSYQDFIVNKTFQLNKECPLREQPNDTSRIIDSYDKFTSFQVVEFKGEWIRVKPDFELYGSSDLSGWVRLEKERNLQITNINFSF